MITDHISVSLFTVDVHTLYIDNEYTTELDPLRTPCLFLLLPYKTPTSFFMSEEFKTNVDRGRVSEHECNPDRVIGVNNKHPDLINGDRVRYKMYQTLPVFGSPLVSL